MLFEIEIEAEISGATSCSPWIVVYPATFGNARASFELLNKEKSRRGRKI
jgi:hypothetical protein